VEHERDEDEGYANCRADDQTHHRAREDRADVTGQRVGIVDAIRTKCIEGANHTEHGAGHSDQRRTETDDEAKDQENEGQPFHVKEFRPPEGSCRGEFYRNRDFARDNCPVAR